MNEAVSPRRAAWLLTRLFLVRLRNILMSGMKRADKGTRGGTPGKGGIGVLVVLVCTVLWLPGLALQMWQMVSNVRLAVGTAAVPRPAEPRLERTDRPSPVDEAFKARRPARIGRRAPPARHPLPRAAGLREAAPVITALAAILCLAMLCALHGTLMVPDLWRPEWSLEWLYTMPLAVRTLIAVRTFAGTFTNIAGLLMLGPLLAVLAWDAGCRWSAPAVAIGLALPLLVLNTLVRQVVELSLRLSFDPARLRNLQATFTLGGFVLWLPAMFFFSPASEDPSHRGYALLAQAPSWVTWLPPGLAVRALTSLDPVACAGYVVALFMETAAIAMFAVDHLERRLAGGLLAGGGRESVARVAAAPVVPPVRRWLTAFQGKTMMLLRRDRNLLVTVFGLPVFLLIQQAMTFGDASLLSSVERVGAAAFVIGAMAVAMALPQVVLKESETFWFLLTFPRRTDALLLEAAALFGVAMSVFPLTALAIGMVTVRAPFAQWAGMATLVMVGMVIHTVTAAGLAVLSSDPTTNDPRKQLAPWGMYLFFALSGIYAQGLLSGSPWHAIGAVSLSSMLAFAFWQKATDHLPYLLDPTAAPPARLSLSDGLVAAQIFFLLQALVIAGGRSDASITLMVHAFAIAGGVTTALVLLSFWRQQMTGLPRLIGPGMLNAIGEGIVFGALAAAFGLLWIKLMVPPVPPGAVDDARALMLLAVLAAPAFEEFIFRGLVYTGLRRSLPLAPAAVASALLFAVLHPPLAVVPVFAMALCATIAFERSGLLVASMIVHAIYNAVVVGAQF